MNKQDWKTQRQSIKESYKVPQDYFDTFTGHLMNELPAVESMMPSNFFLRHLRAFISTAAVVIILVGTGIALTLKDNPSIGLQSQFSTHSAEVEEQFIDDMLDYTTLSTNDILSCVQESDLQP